MTPKSVGVLLRHVVDVVLVACAAWAPAAYPTVTAPAPSNFHYSVSLKLPDGRMLSAGWVYSGSGYAFAVRRDNADGSSDPTFGGTGAVVVPIWGYYESVSTLAVQPDGRIIVGGNAADPAYRNDDACYPAWCMTYPALIRLNADGSLDLSFNRSGMIVISIGDLNSSYDVEFGYLVSFVLAPDGKIVIYSEGNTAVARLNQDGTLDTSFVGTSDVAKEILLRIPVNQRGLTGSWSEPAKSGQGFEIEIYPDGVAPGTGLLQGGWFTFAADGLAGGTSSQRWYTFSGSVQAGQSSIPLTFFRNTGGKFGAPPVTNAVNVGHGTLSFSSCISGTLDYAFTDGSNATGQIPLVRLTRNLECSASPPAASPTAAVHSDFGFSGNWYDPTASGQGLVVELNPHFAAPQIFLAWYTYASASPGNGDAGQRWYTGQASYTPGSRKIDVTLYETTGGLFDQVTDPPPTTAATGRGTMTFVSCGAARFDFIFTGGGNAGQSGSIPLSRVGPVPQDCGP